MNEVVVKNVEKLVMGSRYNKIAGGVGIVVSLVFIHLGKEGKPLNEFAKFINNVLDEV